MDSRRPRAGRRFLPGDEQSLYPDALHAAAGLPGSRGQLRIFGEVTGPFGIPDFLALNGVEAVLQDRLALAVPPLLNEIDAAIVACSSAVAKRGLESLAQRVGWQVETVERRLPGLLRSGALIDVGRSRYVRPSALIPVGRLYAVETKLRNFRRALRQGRTYALWCENYVLVMQSVSEALLAEAVTTVAGDRGGLMVSGRWLQRPRSRRLSPARRLWGSEHLIAAMLGTDHQPSVAAKSSRPAESSPSQASARDVPPIAATT